MARGRASGTGATTRWGIAETGNSNPARQAALDGGLDQSRCEGRLTKIATVLKVPVASLVGAADRTGHVREQPVGIGTPLKLLTISGALKLLRAFNNLSDGKMRRSIVQHVENIAALRGRGSKRV
jgi:hypothetical protein